MLTKVFQEVSSDIEGNDSVQVPLVQHVPYLRPGGGGGVITENLTGVSVRAVTS